MNSGIFTPAVALMSRMPISKQFAVLAFLFLLPMLLMVGVFTVDRMDIIQITKSEKVGVLYIKDMRNLLRDVAQSRGMTNAYLNGKTEIKGKLESKLGEVDSHYQALLATDAKYNAEIGLNPAQELLDKWVSLKASVFTRPAPEAFKAYTQHLNHIRRYMVHIADKSNLILGDQLDTYYLMDNVVIQMPLLLDALGQTRGMGSGIAAAGKFTPDGFTSLTARVEESRLFLSSLESGVVKIYQHNDAAETTLGPAVSEFITAAEAFLQTTDKQLLQPDSIQVGAVKYFDTGTAAINKGFVLFDAMTGLLDDLLAQRIADKYNMLILGYIGLFTMLFGTAYLFMGFYRSTMHGIREINGVVDAIADGDLTRYADVDSKDELGAIAHNTNAMVEKINALVSQVISASNQVSQGADEAETTANNSRDGINRQNSEIEQVAAAINEMSATVQEVARNASSAAEETQSATNESNNGKRVVHQAIDAINNLSQEMTNATEVIHELEVDSDNIGTVLDVIRGIAEQTNLLALNAAIEAARAGEQGRGFAVVADEVRTLASRTQQSTEEIQQMIQKLQSGAQNAVTVMEQGNAKTSESVQLAAEAGAALEAIASAVVRINDMNAQIASAAEEQSSVAMEIDRNVVNIRDIAGETVAGAEHTAASSRTMNQVAGQLMSLVKEFKV